MIWEGVAVYLVLALYLGGFFALLLKRSWLGRGALIVASLLSLAIFLSFVDAFLSNDFSLEAVFQSSSQSLPLYLKLAATWTGAPGSLLLWLGVMASALIVYESRGILLHEQDRATSLIISFFMVYVVIAVITANPFAQIGNSTSNGLGLTPSLQSFWTVIHPPTVFAAYTAVLFLFATAVSRRWRNQGDWSTDGKLLRASWLLLTLGIAFGGIWAYQTEGFGGYWAWDPIETSALIPWLALTAVLIAERTASRGREFFGITFSASTLLFTAYVARGSAAPTVHGYGDVASGIPFFLLALFPVFISSAAVVRSRFRGVAASREVGMMTIDSWEFLCLILLASANLVLLLLESFAPIFGIAFEPNPQLHNNLSFPFLAVFIALLSTECVVREPRAKHFFVAFFVPLGIGLGLSLTGIASEGILFAVGLPFVVLLLVASVYGVARVSMRNLSRPRLRLMVRYLTFFGMAVLLLGVWTSSALRTSASGVAQVGQSVGGGGTEITVVGITTTPSTGRVYLPGYGSVPESIDTKVTYSLDGQAGRQGTAVLSYYPRLDEFVQVPSIEGSISGDVYVVLASTSSVNNATAEAFRSGEATEPVAVDMTLQTIPGILLVWLGIAVMVLANVPLILWKEEGVISSQTGAVQRDAPVNLPRQD